MHKQTIITLILSTLSILLYAQINFEEVAQDVGLENVSFGSNIFGNGGISFYDFDNDGWDDISMATSAGDTILFFRNNNGLFEKVEPAFVSNTGQIKHILWADYNNDGNPDLFVTTDRNGNSLYKNTGSLNFVDVTSQVGISTDSMATMGAAWGDINNDGWLDLAIANFGTIDSVGTLLYLNDGQGSFTDITEQANIFDTQKPSFGMVFSDLNGDGYQDMYFSVDHFFGNSVYLNNGDLSFEDVTQTCGGGLEMYAMCIAAGDYDNDGVEDFYFTSMPPDGAFLSRCSGNGTFNEVSVEAGVNWQSDGWGSIWLDGDLDGDLDLFVNGQVPAGTAFDVSIFYENMGDGTFTELVGSNIDNDVARSFANAVGDFNNDGLPDFVVLNGEEYNITLWENTTSTNNGFLKVDLKGVESNRDGIGSWIEVYTDTLSQFRYTHCANGYLAQNMGYELFGLEKHEIIDSVKVRWLSGMVDVLYNVLPNQKITVTEGETSSTTGIGKYNSSVVRIYPNPASDLIHIISSDKSLILTGLKVFDVSGREIEVAFEIQSGSSIIVNTSTLKNGSYYLQLLHKNGKITKQIIIAN